MTAGATALTGLTALSIIANLPREVSGHEAPAGVPVWAATAALVLLQAASLLWVERAPIVALLLVAGLPLALAGAFPSALYSVTALPILVASYHVGLRTRLSRTRWWVAVAVALVAAGQFVNVLLADRADYGAALLGAATQAVIVVCLPLLPAVLVATRRQARAAHENAIAAAARERDANIGEAVAVERAAMARELHDIAAHHLSGISIMASAVAKQIPVDPDAAIANALHIRSQSNSVLDDLRRLVGLLRDIGDSDEVVKTLATVPSLIEAARQRGQAIRVDELHADPDAESARGVGPLAQLAAYRMVQEALTNAATHALGAPVRVVLDDRDPAAFSLSVRNTAPGAAAVGDDGSGFGLVGMRERAVLVGGSLDAGPTDSGGWEVRMRIPRETRVPDRPEAAR